MALIIAAVGLLTALVLALFDVRDSGFISAYRSAANCSSPANALSTEGCRYQGRVNVVSTSTEAGHKTVVSFASLPGQTFTTFFPTGGEPDSTALTAGGTAAAELWSGKVTRLAGKPTNNDPEEYPTTGLLEIAAFLAVLAIPLLGVGGWMARAARRRS